MGPKMNARQLLNGAENKRQAAASRRRSGQHSGRTPGITPAHLGSPLRHPTGGFVQSRSVKEGLRRNCDKPRLFECHGERGSSIDMEIEGCRC